MLQASARSSEPTKLTRPPAVVRVMMLNSGMWVASNCRIASFTAVTSTGTNTTASGFAATACPISAICCSMSSGFSGT
jgi:hypothetical protein